MSIVQEVGQAARDIINEVIELQASYNFPMRDVPRPYPALLVLYDGFSSADDEDTNDAYVTDLKYALTLYLPFDGRNMEARWDELTNLAWTIIVRFANDVTLGGTCRQCGLSAGEPVLHMSGAKPPKPVGMGHTFSLTARVETEEE